MTKKTAFDYSEELGHAMMYYRTKHQIVTMAETIRTLLIAGLAADGISVNDNPRMPWGRPSNFIGNSDDDDCEED